MQDQRVIYNAIDISQKVNDYRTGSQAFAYVAGGYLYIGAVMPFNNLWFELGTVNSNSVTPSIKIWFGNSWVDAVDVIDETSGMSATGRISWNTDQLKGWDLVQSSELVSGITSFKIYWKYWARISWSANFSAGTTLNYVGQKFSDDDVLYSFYPDLNNTDIKTGFEAGKTTWDEQHYMAAEHIVRDLQKRGVIKSRGQILDWSLMQAAACHKVAEMVYRSFGQPYAEQMALARKDYEAALDARFLNIDKNANGSLDPCERGVSTMFGTR